MRLLLSVVFLLVSMQSMAINTITVGVEPFKTPFSTQVDNEGKFMGFEISLMDEICKRIEVKCIYKPVQFSNIITSLDNHSIDIAISTIFITEERQRSYLFSNPYHTGKTSVLVDKDNIKKLQDLEGKKVATIAGIYYEKVIPQLIGHDVKVVTYPDLPDLLYYLYQGRVDAVVLHKEIATFWASKSKNLTVLEPLTQTGLGYGIMTKNNNIELVKQINAAIKSMEDDGTYLKIYKEYFD